MATIVKDLVTRKDEFRDIAPHDLAAALGIPDAESPGTDRWNWIRFGRKVSPEEYAADYFPASEVIYLIQNDVPAARFQQFVALSADFDGDVEPDFHFMTPHERQLLEAAIGARDLQGAQDSGFNTIAQLVLKTKSGYPLLFEAVIEDDGSCIELRTPYDYRDGRFVDLRDCVTDSW